MSKYQFKPGERVLPADKVLAFDKDVPMDKEHALAVLKHIGTSLAFDGHPMLVWWNKRVREWLESLPAPREGEYRLTLEELVTLCYDSENYPYFQDDEERANFVKRWLANRKEEA